jgi:hypothetical protein
VDRTELADDRMAERATPVQIVFRVCPAGLPARRIWLGVPLGRSGVFAEENDDALSVTLQRARAADRGCSRALQLCDYDDVVGAGVALLESTGHQDEAVGHGAVGGPRGQRRRSLR